MKDIKAPTKMVSVLAEEEQKLGAHYHSSDEQFGIVTHRDHQLLTMTREERITELEDKLEKAMNYDFDLVESIQEKIDLYTGMTDAEYKSYIRTKMLYARNSIKPIIPTK